MIRNHYLSLMLVCAVSWLAGCAGSPSSSQQSVTAESEAVDSSLSEPILTEPDRLYGRSWLLEGPEQVMLDPKSRPDLLINENGRLNASTGCNTFFGSVGVDEQGGFVSDMGGMSMMSCSPEVNKQEQLFLQALKNSSQYYSQGDKLYLLDARGNVLLAFGLME